MSSDQPIQDGTLFISADSAAGAHDPALRLMGRTLQLLTALVPTACAAFYPTNGGPSRHSGGPIVSKVSHRGPVDDDVRVSEYVTRYHAVDPFQPELHIDSAIPIIGVDELGGRAAFDRSPWAAEYLAESGFGTQVVMFLRDEGRIAAGISLATERRAPELSRQQMLLLHRAQPLIEQGYILAKQASVPLEHEHRLHGRGLTSREIEVARLVAGGAGTEEIARVLVISADTVRTHVKHVYAKLDVHSRVQLSLMLGPDTTASEGSGRPDDGSPT